MISILLINIIVQIVILLISYGLTNRSILLIYSQTHSFLNHLTPIMVFINAYRHQVAFTFTISILILLISQIYILKSKKTINKKIIVLIGISTVLAVFSYPFLSTDIFSYLFSSKIVTFYKTNPYTVRPDFFKDDLWLSFTQWVDNKYAYGPIFLLITSLPMAILGPARLFINFFGLKTLSLISFVVTGLVINKHNKDNWKLWFLSPLLVIEILINSHNDIYMIMFFILSIHFAVQKNTKLSILFFLLSVFTKYVSIILLPLYIFTLYKHKINSQYFKIATLALLVFITLKGVHTWYLTWLFFTLPFSDFKPNTSIWISTFAVTRIIQTYPCFLRNGQWGMCSIGNIASAFYIPIFLICLLKIAKEIQITKKLRL